MRLSEETRQAIVELFQRHFPRGKLYLFGSRVNPNARGGDIDLLCEMDGDPAALIKKKSAFLIALEKRIGEQQIDFVLYQPSETPDLAIAKIAKETGVRIDMNDNIESCVAIAERHNKRLSWAIKKMASFMPLTAERFEKLSDEEVAILDMFSTRFGKLQDILGVKVLPMILELTEEPGVYLTFIDKLNRLEKMLAIPSADDWSAFRKVRNSFTHDYPDNPKLNASLLNAAYEQGKKLQSTFDYIKNYIQKTIKP
ncbi:MAG: nucleotidyltransferase domain-containing protein [Gammaproteobacteria bacterium]|nr:nucleotidyltransferase domain-containing protein [Gammaproteobacteria bacterium]